MYSASINGVDSGRIRVASAHAYPMWTVKDTVEDTEEYELSTAFKVTGKEVIARDESDVSISKHE